MLPVLTLFIHFLWGFVESWDYDTFLSDCVLSLRYFMFVCFATNSVIYYTKLALIYMLDNVIILSC